MMKMLMPLFAVVAMFAPGVAFADVCAAPYAELADESVTVEPADCVTAGYQGREFGGCGENVSLWIENGCETALQFDKATGLRCEDTSDGYTALVDCEVLEPGQRGQVMLNAPAPEEVEVVQVELTPPTEQRVEPETIIVQAEYSTHELDTSNYYRDNRRLCSTALAAAPATPGSLLLLAFGFLFWRRRSS